MTIRTLIAEPGIYSEAALETYRRLGSVEWLNDEQADLLARMADVDVLVVRLHHRVTAAHMDASPSLKIIGTSTTGLDHIDLDAARERGIEVVSLKGETAFLRSIHASAEHTVALMFALIRRVPEAVSSALAGSWEQSALMGSELHGKTLGLIGFGRIGSLVAKMVSGLGMNVIAVDPNVTDEEIRRGGATPVSLEMLLETSDIVSLHVPLESTTEGMVDAQMFRRMKPGARFINTSRGALVDEEALIEALTSGKLAGAAVDVISREGQMDMSEHPLIQYAHSHPRLIVTPHIAGTTRESLEMTQAFIAEKIAAILRGRGLVS